MRWLWMLIFEVRHGHWSAVWAAVVATMAVLTWLAGSPLARLLAKVVAVLLGILVVAVLRNRIAQARRERRALAKPGRPRRRRRV